MSDGPHKSLSMARHWKRLAERADNAAFAPNEVGGELPPALERDWRAEVPDSLSSRVRLVLSSDQESLFADGTIDQLEGLRLKHADQPLAGVFLEFLMQSVAQGETGDDAVCTGAERALNDRAMRRARQIEEHYRRKGGRSSYVRERIERAVMQTELATVAKCVTGVAPAAGTQPIGRRTGLDDGVQL